MSRPIGPRDQRVMENKMFQDHVLAFFTSGAIIAVDTGDSLRLRKADQRYSTSAIEMK